MAADRTPRGQVNEGPSGRPVYARENKSDAIQLCDKAVVISECLVESGRSNGGLDWTTGMSPVSLGGGQCPVSLMFASPELPVVGLVILVETQRV